MNGLCSLPPPPPFPNPRYSQLDLDKSFFSLLLSLSPFPSLRLNFCRLLNLASTSCGPAPPALTRPPPRSSRAAPIRSISQPIPPSRPGNVRYALACTLSRQRPRVVGCSSHPRRLQSALRVRQMRTGRLLTVESQTPPYLEAALLATTSGLISPLRALEDTSPLQIPQSPREISHHPRVPHRSNLARGVRISRRKVNTVA